MSLKVVESETKWLDRLRTGDRAACEELYDRFATGMYRYALSIVQDPGASEDVVQEVLAAFFQVLAANKPIDHIQSYLYRSLRNRSYNSLRSEIRQRKKMEVYSTLRESVAAPAEEGDEKTERLYAALESLPPPQRDVVMMRMEGELTFEDIADLCGSNVNTVYKRYKLAIQKLQEQLL